MYSLMVIVDILATLFFDLFVNWWAPLFAKNDHLPSWLKWVDTFDNPLSFGAYQNDVPDSYWQRVMWLYRNSGYGFDYWVLGIPFNPDSWKITKNSGSIAGHDYDFEAVSDDGKFNRVFCKYGLLIKTGWKAANCLDSNQRLYPRWSRLPFVFSISING